MATAFDVKRPRSRAPSGVCANTFPVCCCFQYNYSGSSDLQPESTAREPAMVSLLDCLQAPQEYELTRKCAPADVFVLIVCLRVSSNLCCHVAAVAVKVLLVQPSSAAAERVFSMLQNSFQDASLSDYVQTPLIMRILLPTTRILLYIVYYITLPFVMIINSAIGINLSVILSIIKKFLSVIGLFLEQCSIA